MSEVDRVKVLAAFIRGQAHLTDGHPHKPGPGCVKLNHEEALTVAAALEELLAFRAIVASARVRHDVQ